MDSQKFCLKWDGFQGSVTSVFDQLRSGGELLDVTLCCEGQRVRAHRMMLSACSPYFRELLKSISCQQMVIFLKDTTAADLSAIVEFMYKGSVNVSQSQLASFIKTAEMLQIRGLSGEEDKHESENIKVEKVDLSDGEDGGSLDAALGQLNEFEGYGSTATSAQGVSFAGGHQYGPLPTGLPGASHQSPHGAPMDDGSAPALRSPEATSCHVCGRYYTTARALRAHMKVHLGLTTCRICLKVICTVGHLRRHLQSEHRLTPEEVRQMLDSGAYVCVVCGKRYRHQMSLTLHRKVHEGLTICPLCGTVSSKVSHLRRHLENVHRLEQEQIYRLVPSVRARSLPQALAGVDTGHGDGEIAGTGAEFFCTLCGQRYRSHRSLMSHTKLHQGLTVCHLCGKVSNNRPDLRKHLSMMHGLSSEEVQAYVPDGRRRGT
ncbi:Broad-complex core protein isoforms 1/2/3/4/5 [Amphibalanus amphitrite]|uniref:Broad-complex core protein isoforms 1/2/3/4/5 n=1 Tax=Amphibalanus amphitrite TaxID=1232801 RepID=A0A6A4WB94_AMPAM|nr:Broad-complex core protein isoforms 1/2/3/4/5 [Amphibalanus amphitrite]